MNQNLPTFDTDPYAALGRIEAIAGDPSIDDHERIVRIRCAVAEFRSSVRAASILGEQVDR